MKNIVGLALRAFGILVYVALFALFIMRLVTDSGDPLAPFLGIIMISGFSALISLTTQQTMAVSALVEATNSEIDLLMSMSQVGSFPTAVPQNDRLN